jgi:hypothetical protein
MASNDYLPIIALTLRSTRTPPALSSALSQLPASSAPFIVSVQAGPVSSFVRPQSKFCADMGINDREGMR